MAKDWTYLLEFQKNKPGTLAKILKHNAPRYVKQKMKEAFKNNKEVKNVLDIAFKSKIEEKSVVTVLKELGIENKKNKYGKGALRCVICGSHERVVRRYGIMICGRCFREYADLLGFRVMGE